MKQKRQRLAIKNSSQELRHVRNFLPIIQREREKNYIVEASKIGTIWKFFIAKWLLQCKVEKLHMLHSSRSETSPQWLSSVVVIPPIKNHYPQWNQIPQSLIYSVFASIGALLLGANLTFKISKEIKNVAMNGLDQKLNKFYMSGFYLSWKSNQEEWKA